MAQNNSLMVSDTDLLYDPARYTGVSPVVIDDDNDQISLSTEFINSVNGKLDASATSNWDVTPYTAGSNITLTGHSIAVSDAFVSTVNNKLDTSATSSWDVTPYTAGSNITLTGHSIAVSDSLVSTINDKLDASATSDWDVTPYTAGSNISITNHVVNVADNIELGSSNGITGTNDIIVGTSNTISGNGILAVGSSNSVAANNNVVFGGSNTVAASKTDNVVIGQSNTANNTNCVLIGNNLTTTKNNAVYIGQSQNTYTLNDSNGFGIVKAGRLDYVNNFPIPIVVECELGYSFIQFYAAPEDSYGVPFTLSYRCNSNGYTIRIGSSEHCKGKYKLDNGNWGNFNASANTVISSSPFVTTDYEIHELEIFTWEPTDIHPAGAPGAIGRYKFKLFNYTLNNTPYWIVWKDMEYHEEYIPSV